MIENFTDLIEIIKDEKIAEHKFENIELKSDWAKEHGQKISALANKIVQKKAWIIVGINDNGGLCAHNESWAKNREEIISQHINQFLRPTQACPQIKCLEIKGSWVIVIGIIPPGLVTRWNGDAYKASGTTISRMEPAEIMQLTISLPGLHDYSAQEWDGAYDPALVLQFAEAISAKRKDTIFENLNSLPTDEILKRVGIKNRNVTRILFGDFKFRIVYYNASEEPIDNTTHSGLYRLLSNEFVQSIMLWTKKELHLQKSGLSVSSEDPYPIKAIREVFANTVAHAAYFEKMGDILIEIFTDKLMISNLCVPEAAYFANKWFSKSHHTVNNLLAETLRIGGYVDEVGRGKNVIFSESINTGKNPPLVNIESGGHYKRWRLILYDGMRDELQLKLLERIKQVYKDLHMAMVANALVLWREQPVSAIRQYIDGESIPIFKDVLADLNGPVFYYAEHDKFILRRWASVLLEEGKDSKKLSIPEEEDLFKFAYDIQSKFKKGIITPKELRELARMGHTQSEKVLTSGLMKKWVKEKRIKNISKGVYQFVEPKIPLTAEADLTKFLDSLKGIVNE